MGVHDQVGDRPLSEVASYSARPSSYLAATPTNRLYGGTFASRGGPERHLFPGIIAVVLALVGLLLRVPSTRVIVYLLLLVAAFETSLGLGGYSYTFLYDHVSLYRGLRASARLGIFVLLFLGVLAAYGYQALAEGRSMLVRAALAVFLALGLVAEYRISPDLVPFANTAPPVYRMLAHQPPGVVAEFPVPRADTLPGDEAEYAYMSTFHWMALVNGYSGNYPPSYLARLGRLTNFPDDRSIRQLRQDHVTYVVVHGSANQGSAFQKLRVRIQLDGALVELGAFDDADGHAVLYRLR